MKNNELNPSKSYFIGDITTKDSQETLKRRASALSSTEKESKKYSQYICFQLGEDEYYGIPYHSLQEILHSKKIEPVPGMADPIIGVINWRSRILAVMDLKKMFNIESVQNKVSPWVIIVKSGNIVVGIVADEMIGNKLYVKTELSEALPLGHERKNIYVKGIFEGNITMLDIDKLIESQIEMNQLEGQNEQRQ